MASGGGRQSKAVQSRETIPLTRLKRRTPDENGNRQQRRAFAARARTGSLVQSKPGSAEELIARIEAEPNWRSMPIADFAKLIGLPPGRARILRQALLSQE